MESYVDYLQEEMCSSSNISNTSNTSNTSNISNSTNLFVFEIGFEYLYFLVKSIMTLFLIASVSLGGSVFIVSHALYKPMVNSFCSLYRKNSKIFEIDEFLLEYLDDYEKLDTIKFDNNFLELLNIKFIKHETPNGVIIMNYDYENESFNYYFEKSHKITFNYLDVVSRIYVVKFHCKNIYIEPSNEKDEKDKKDEKDEKDELFYKKKKANEFSDKYVSNKYKYKGTIKDFTDKVKKYNFKTYNYDSNEQIGNVELYSNFAFYLVNKNYNNFDYLEDVINLKRSDIADKSISFKTFKSYMQKQE